MMHGDRGGSPLPIPFVQEELNFAIADLGEIHVPFADGAERLGRAEADATVGFFPQPPARLRGPDRNGDEDLRRLQTAHIARRDQHCRTGRESVVHQYNRAGLQIQRRTISAVQLFATREFRGFLGDDSLHFGARNADAVDQFPIQNPERSAGDGAHCQFRLRGYPQFADNHDVQRRAQSRRDLPADRNAAARQRQDDDVCRQIITQQFLREKTARFGSIGKRKVDHVPSLLGEFTPIGHGFGVQAGGQFWSSQLSQNSRRPRGILASVPTQLAEVAKMAGTGKKRSAAKARSPREKTAAPRRAMKPIDESSPIHPEVSFPVVAIGASAGGLDAFTALLHALPPETGMAFVLIQHLEPKHESALTSLLSKTTAMRVVEVSDGMGMEPNHVYVIPPNTNMTIRKGVLRLAPRSELFGLQRPIDDFSMALAEEQGSAAIGVVLSGTGSDGTYGLKAIKAAGGVTFAQDPKTAQWSAMPMSAITAGSVDFVLSPKAIAAELARIGRHPYVVEAREVPEGSELDKLCLILRSAVGVDFRLYKQATVRRRIARRMALQKIASLEKYAHILKQNPVEAQALADDIFIHVTRFFRDPECFQALRKQVLAKLGVKRSPDDPIRVWVAGCSTGEEVYSIAILLLEELGEKAHRVKIQIFGTDIQEHAVERARAGVYTEAAVDGVSPARLKRFFLKTDSGYQIQKSIRDVCVFARHDLAKDPPFSRLDLVSCRNVLIYFAAALQKRALSMFQYALKPGGFLFLGTSESISEYSDSFTVVDRKHRIFARKLAVGPLEINVSTGRSPVVDLLAP